MLETKLILALLSLVEAGTIKLNELRRLLLETGSVSETVNRLVRQGISIDLSRSDEEIERLSRLGMEIIPITSPRYPSMLRGVGSAPPVIFKRGRASLNGKYVAIVGSRKPTSEGRHLARQFAKAFVKMGFSIVSGLALGIDTEAHRGALDAGGETIAVLGCDLERIYPNQNRGLAQVIVGRGALVSEHRCANPTSENLVLRNRLISGLSRIVLVLEPERGALRTVQYAVAQARPVFIVAKLNSRGFLRRDDGVYLVDHHAFSSVDETARQIALRNFKPEDLISFKELG